MEKKALSILNLMSIEISIDYNNFKSHNDVLVTSIIK